MMADFVRFKRSASNKSYFTLICWRWAETTTKLSKSANGWRRLRIAGKRRPQKRSVGKAHETQTGPGDTHEFVNRQRFPGDWPTIELLKQFLKNHRKHDRKMGRLEPYKKAQQARRAAPRSLPNIDNDEEPTGSDD